MGVAALIAARPVPIRDRPFRGPTGSAAARG
jgi:hypothetical protein